LKYVDGVMLGRAAYHNTSILADVDHRIHGEEALQYDWMALRDTMMAYAADYIATGGRLNHVTRHMVGLFQGMPGARR
ncbi:tRNA-dihydrouridine synthase, partial [Pseudomonas protegens]